MLISRERNKPAWDNELLSDDWDDPAPYEDLIAREIRSTGKFVSGVGFEPPNDPLPGRAAYLSGLTYRARDDRKDRENQDYNFYASQEAHRRHNAKMLERAIMNREKYLLESVPRSPDEPAAEFIAAEEAPAVEPVVAAEPAEHEPQPEPEPAPTDHGNKGKTPWYMNRINEETNRRRGEAEAHQRTQRELAEARALLDRMQSGEQPAPQAPRTEQPQDIRSLVKAEAEQQRFVEDTVAVRDAGLSEFSNFNETLQILTAIGATGDEFVADVLAVDKAGAHKVFDALAKDPEKTASLVGMNSRRRIAELTRMTMTTTEPKPAAAAPSNPLAAVPAAPKVSAAPRPAPSMAPVAKHDDGDILTADNVSDDEWSAAYNRKMAKAG